MLSILFRNPNFLILDEPTNDLDLPTLGVLENFLADFPGCLLIISHDRYFMDRLVDHLLVFEGDGMVRDFPGNYAIYRASLDEKGKNSLPGTLIEPSKEEPVAQVTVPETTKRKMGFKEKREFEILEKEIAALTKEKNEVTVSLNSGNMPFDQLEKLSNRIGEISATLDEKELRWLELSEG